MDPKITEKKKKHIRKKSLKTGLPPGSLVYLGEEEQKKRIQIVHYTQDHLETKMLENIQECLPYLSKLEGVSWIQIEGLSDIAFMEKVGETFSIDKLFLEDVLNVYHHPKIEELDHLLFMILKVIFMENGNEEIQYGQLNLFLGKNFVITFQENSHHISDIVMDRLNKRKGKLRESEADYLFYSIIDVCVDGFFTVLDSIVLQIEVLENKMSREVEAKAAIEISHLKKKVLFLKKVVIPIKESIEQIIRIEFEEIKPKTTMYLNDAYEHTTEVLDILDTYREMLTSLSEIHTSHINFKTSEVMIVLTMFSSIFSPLTFIVGVYGMNFAHMPELQWRWGYFLVWGVMACILVGMVYFFKKKRWI